MFDVEVTTPIGLVADIAHDPYALLLEFGVQRIGIVDPDVAVPRPTFRIDQAVRTHRSGCFELGQHDDDTVPLDHAKRWRLVPEALIVESELVPVIGRGFDDVVDDEVRSDAPT